MRTGAGEASGPRTRAAPTWATHQLCDFGRVTWACGCKQWMYTKGLVWRLHIVGGHELSRLWCLGRAVITRCPASRPETLPLNPGHPLQLSAITPVTSPCSQKEEPLLLAPAASAQVRSASSPAGDFCPAALLKFTIIRLLFTAL